MTASILQQLLAIYFAIIYSWQLSSGEKLLVGKKTQPYISRIFADLDFFHKDFFFSFSLRNVCLPCRLRKAYSVL